MIIGINKSETLIKHMSCEFKCKFDGKKCNSNQKWNKDKCRCECKNPKEYNACEKDYIWNCATCSWQNGKYLASVIDDSIIMCDEIVDTTKTVPTNFNEKKVTCTLKISLFHSLSRSSHSEVFLRKSVLKICAKFTGEHSCQSATSIKLQSKFIEVALRDGLGMGVLL